MSGRFKLDIALGNDAMQTPMDVATVLRAVVAKLEGWRNGPPPSSGIRDVNGNTVGSWSYEPVTNWEECQTCGGELTELGTLGDRTHYRCRACGLDQS